MLVYFIGVPCNRRCSRILLAETKPQPEHTAAAVVLGVNQSWHCQYRWVSFKVKYYRLDSFYYYIIVCTIHLHLVYVFFNITLQFLYSEQFILIFVSRFVLLHKLDSEHNNTAHNPDRDGACPICAYQWRSVGNIWFDFLLTCSIPNIRNSAKLWLHKNCCYCTFRYKNHIYIRTRLDYVYSALWRKMYARTLTKIASRIWSKLSQVVATVIYKRKSRRI